MKELRDLNHFLYLTKNHLTDLQNRLDLGLIELSDFKKIKSILDKSNYLTIKRIQFILKEQI